MQVSIPGSSASDPDFGRLPQAQMSRAAIHSMQSHVPQPHAWLLGPMQGPKAMPSVALKDALGKQGFGLRPRLEFVCPSQPFFMGAIGRELDAAVAASSLALSRKRW